MSKQIQTYEHYENMENMTYMQIWTHENIRKYEYIYIYDSYEWTAQSPFMFMVVALALFVVCLQVCVQILIDLTLCEQSEAMV